MREEYNSRVYEYLHRWDCIIFFIYCIFLIAPKWTHISRLVSKSEKSEERIVNARLMMSTGSSFACESHAHAFIAHIPGLFRIINATEWKVTSRIENCRDFCRDFLSRLYTRAPDCVAVGLRERSEATQSVAIETRSEIYEINRKT